jgi:hypothetical protein
MRPRITIRSTLIDAEFVAPVIVKPGGARRGMVRHRRGLLERADEIGAPVDARARAANMRERRHDGGSIGAEQTGGHGRELTSRRFGPLVATQFLSALNDNALRTRWS